MIDWFITNKEWVFGGIGVALPIAIISLFFAQKSKNQKQVQKSGDDSINIQVGNDLNINKSQLEEKND